MVPTATSEKSQTPDTAGAVRPLVNGAEALARTLRLLPDIRARARYADEHRRLPDETIEALRASGLFGIATPKKFGGSELGFGALVDVSAALASACGSTGWVFGVLTGHNWMVALFPEEAQREVFADPRTLTATVFRLQGTTVREGSGYRLTGGEGRFCSGIDYSDWVIVGNAVQLPDGTSEDRFLLVPRSDVEVVDDWHTVGMRGTGSRTIRIENAFIPEYRTIRSSDAVGGTTPGARLHGPKSIYSVPFPIAQPFSLVGTPLGIMAGAVEAFTQSLKRKVSGYASEQIGEQGLIFDKLAEAAADCDAARGLIMADCALVDAFGDFTRVDRTRIQRDFAYAARTCRKVVTSLFEVSGGSGIYNTSVDQRFWRDGSSATAHTAFNWTSASAEFARAVLDLPRSPFAGSRR